MLMFITIVENVSTEKPFLSICVRCCFSEPEVDGSFLSSLSVINIVNYFNLFKIVGSLTLKKST